jgi:hypothetical protein
MELKFHCPIRFHGVIFNYIIKYKINLPSFLSLYLSKGYSEVFKLAPPHRTSSDCEDGGDGHRKRKVIKNMLDKKSQTTTRCGIPAL